VLVKAVDCGVPPKTGEFEDNLVPPKTDPEAEEAAGLDDAPKTEMVEAEGFGVPPKTEPADS